MTFDERRFDHHRMDMLMSSDRPGTGRQDQSSLNTGDREHIQYFPAEPIESK
jgi:hypothetical protein